VEYSESIPWFEVIASLAVTGILLAAVVGPFRLLRILRGKPPFTDQELAERVQRHKSK
jgi:hypothetical protein